MGRNFGRKVPQNRENKRKKKTTTFQKGKTAEFFLGGRKVGAPVFGVSQKGDLKVKLRRNQPKNLTRKESQELSRLSGMLRELERKRASNGLSIKEMSELELTKRKVDKLATVKPSVKTNLVTIAPEKVLDKPKERGPKLVSGVEKRKQRKKQALEKAIGSLRSENPKRVQRKIRGTTLNNMPVSQVGRKYKRSK